jgi:hypothetical protein
MENSQELVKELIDLHIPLSTINKAKNLLTAIQNNICALAEIGIIADVTTSFDKEKWMDHLLIPKSAVS